MGDRKCVTGKKLTSRKGAEKRRLNLLVIMLACCGLHEAEVDCQMDCKYLYVEALSVSMDVNLASGTKQL